MTTNTNFRISRRKVLAGLGTIGVASAGAGLGTTAFFSDTESVNGWLQAGRVDLLVDYRTTYMPWLDLSDADERSRLIGSGMSGNAAPLPDEPMTYVIGQAPDVRVDGGEDDGSVLSRAAWGDLFSDSAFNAAVCADGLDAGDLPEDVRLHSGNGSLGATDFVDGDAGVFVDLADIKPKDRGETTFSLHLCGNPVYLFVHSETDESRTGENTVYEPEVFEGFAEDEASDLAKYVHVRFWYDEDCENDPDEAPENFLYQGSLHGFLELTSRDEYGLQLNTQRDGLTVPKGNCFDPGVYCYGLEWALGCDAAEFEAQPSTRVVMVENSEGELEPTRLNDMREELEFEGLPLDANRVQSDSVGFELTYRAEQCRHRECAAEVDVSTGVADWQLTSAPAPITAGDGVSAPVFTGDVLAWQDPAAIGDAPADCRWLVPDPEFDSNDGRLAPEGEYVYELEFTVPSTATRSACYLDLMAAVDDEGDLEVTYNGDTVTPTQGSFNNQQEPDDNWQEAVAFTIDLESEGPHTLVATVRNDGESEGFDANNPNPTGLLICGSLKCDCEPQPTEENSVV
ncbi:SipW-cognate class signal peptide [Halogranum gelatinilyticum]|uniref:SipW-cognate class signal peptide n=1 Tax=Halogranum gelatinilyticum TaxID=660521 RepID=A0A1G9SN22_9EURY|nr:SipW-dependent-type signal peptide-containing protein [Halogranum gelatinilyticum]SDM36814.1 SipW-cognate class signal peptide [Halogranum gelatinilyticum]